MDGAGDPTQTMVTTTTKGRIRKEARVAEKRENPERSQIPKRGTKKKMS